MNPHNRGLIVIIRGTSQQLVELITQKELAPRQPDLENQNPKNSSGQRKNLRYFGKNKKTSVFDWRPRVLILNPYLTHT